MSEEKSQHFAEYFKNINFENPCGEVFLHQVTKEDDVADNKEIRPDKMEGLPEGYSAHRLEKDDPYYEAERRLVKAFKKNFEPWPCRNNINYFKGMNESGNSFRERLTEEEVKLVVTVFQWIGTPVGSLVVDEAIPGFSELVKKVKHGK